MQDTGVLDAISNHAVYVGKAYGSLQTEAATKMSLIVPFFRLLGYDVFNPEEFVPEFTADYGIKKGEKVDYAICIDGEPVILVEAKHCAEKLDNHAAQLFRYFTTTPAKFGILTNGLQYRFYTDIDNPNVMDPKPFLELDFMNLRDADIMEAVKFSKSGFNADAIGSAAYSLKYVNEFKSVLSKELQEPSDNFVRFLLSDVYTGVKTQHVIDKFRPVVKQAVNNYISELTAGKLKSVLMSQKPVEASVPVSAEVDSVDEKVSLIVTTPEELEAYFLVKQLVKGVVAIEDVTYKDTQNYLNVLYKDNVRKWLCRIELTETRKALVLPASDKTSVRIPLNNIYDIEQHKDKLVEVMQRYIGG